MGKITLDRTNPPTLSRDTKAALAALSPEDIERNAETDPDNPPLTADEIDRVSTARLVQRIRRGTGLTQSAFASLYGIAVARLRDWEQGRHRPDTMALAYLATIAHEPEAVARALERSRAA